MSGLEMVQNRVGLYWSRDEVREHAARRRVAGGLDSRVFAAGDAITCFSSWWVTTPDGSSCPQVYAKLKQIMQVC